MIYQHQALAAGRWMQLSIIEQMANIGSEVERTINWKNKGRLAESQGAFYRALELFDLTMADYKNRARLKEIARARELFADYIAGGNNYNFSGADWQKYFYYFNFAANLLAGRF